MDKHDWQVWKAYKQGKKGSVLFLALPTQDPAEALQEFSPETLPDGMSYELQATIESTTRAKAMKVLDQLNL